MRTIESFTVDYLLANTVEVGDCLEWTAYASGGNTPRSRVGGTSMTVRSILWRLIHGDIPGGHGIGVRCRNALCVHPDCLVARTRGQAQRGVPLKPDHKVRIALAKMTGSYLTPELVHEIRTSPERSKDLDERLCLPRLTSARVRSGKRGRYVPTTTYFAGLGARK